ncbi:MAG TPA: hypothetical protein ENK18_03120 [Deltaproteobacteria bacterium]|nr:hypothetical protein [Deltaproteobacteria bacterium]
MAGILKSLLFRIRDGRATPRELDAARALVLQDARLPEELRTIALLDPDEVASDAAGLLSILGLDDLGATLAAAIAEEIEGSPLREITIADLEEDDDWRSLASILREGLRREAGSVEVAEGVLRRLAVAGWAWGPILARAIQVEAGSVDVVDAVLRALSLAPAPPVAEAVAREAGTIEVTARVMAELSLALAPPVAEAVRAEAGSVDVVDAVLGALALRARPQAVELERMPSSVGSAPTPPRIANDRRAWATIGLAIAAAMLATMIGVAMPWGGSLEDGQMTFAHAGEVVVEDLSYGDDVSVLQTEGDEGAVILWVDEEA